MPMEKNSALKASAPRSCTASSSGTTHCSFRYDMSVPNVAHLDPQRGGCCTVMPYFFDNGILEIPVTTVQDYSLYNICMTIPSPSGSNRSNIIMAKARVHELHRASRLLDATSATLRLQGTACHLDSPAVEINDLWVTTPNEVNRWWRQRAAMTLVQDGDGWRIEGDGAERARIAWASEEDGRLVMSVDDSPRPRPSVRTKSRKPQRKSEKLSHRPRVCLERDD